jgi:hypothetical protein
MYFYNLPDFKTTADRNLLFIFDDGENSNVPGSTELVLYQNRIMPFSNIIYIQTTINQVIQLILIPI